MLAGRKVLIVDDDIRNIFAMTSVLERYEMKVLSAENGQGRDRDSSTATPDIDVVLMDIMMPGMDGHDTMRAIRKIDRFRTLPIIAVTAKAMKGDREKCIEAGASDYIAKPVDPQQLVSMLERMAAPMSSSARSPRAHDRRRRAVAIGRSSIILVVDDRPENLMASRGDARGPRAERRLRTVRSGGAARAVSTARSR